MKYFALLSTLCVFVSAVSAVTDFVPPPVWKNSRYQRSVQLLMSYVKEQTLVTITNVGDVPQQHYYYALPKSVIDSLSIISVELPTGRQAVAAPIHGDTNGDVGFARVRLPVPVAPKSSLQLTVTLMYTNHVTPALPKIYFQDEHQVLFSSTKMPLAAYETSDYSVKFAVQQLSLIHELPLAKEESEAFPGVFQNDAITYTRAGSVAPLTVVPVTLRFVRNLPLPRVYNLNRDVWVSHSGESVSFEEYYELGNDASGLNKGFSRVEWLQGRMAQRYSFAIVAVDLLTSPNAREIYYTDLVGNVSTSIAMEEGYLSIKPRFPLFGGWHYNFTVGWSTDLGQYVKVAEKDSYVMKVPLLAGLRDCTYDTVRLSFFLPEGAVLTDILSAIPYAEKTEDYELSYLDTKGHTKVTLVYHNLVGDLQKAEVLVAYTYDFSARLRKPITVAAYIFAALVGYFALTKVNLAIKPKQ